MTVISLALCGALLGASRAILRRRTDALTRWAVMGAVLGAGVPILLSAGLHALPGWADVVVTLALVAVVVRVLTQAVVTGLFGKRAR